MSTIRVDNFGPSAGGTTYSARGIARAWVNFDGTGTIAVRDSENVSSLTDNGTGDYTVNFSNAFGAADYAVSTCARIYHFSQEGDNITTSSWRGYSFFVSSTAGARSNIDITYLFAAIHGDLA